MRLFVSGALLGIAVAAMTPDVPFLHRVLAIVALCAGVMLIAEGA